MIKKLTKVFVLLSLFIPGIVYSQTNLIYFEDFENANTSLMFLNSFDVGSNTGANLWVVNNKYVGLPVFPNTPSETLTYGGLITHPDSNYLHIHDVNVSAVSNSNFDPNVSSDRFTTLGPFCTLGLDSIHFAFYNVGMGNTNSYGQVYYKADNGPWTLASPAKYSANDKWRYVDITDPAYDNLQNLWFGFRWVNGASPDTATSWGIDDIKLVGTSDPIRYPLQISIPGVFNVPVCQNSSMLIEVTLSTPLCGQGTYDIELSGPGGSFANPVDLGNALLNNYDPFAFLNVNIPSNTVPDSCYRLRIIRTTPSPFVFSDTSPCFQVLKCPNTITTLEAVVLFDPTDTICVGSVIDVPFLSTGVFRNNTYIAQLSDSNGNFNGNNNVLGQLGSSQTFPGPPGTVSGLIAAKSQPIPAGCNYYIRVISTSPATTGSVYGPFCIRHCDVETNNMKDIPLCIPPGIDTCIPIHINMFDTSITYHSGNGFQVDVRSSKDFSQVNLGGLGGIVMSTTDTCLHLVIPDINFVYSLGMQSGLYYIRIVADSSSQPWNTHGTLIRLIIGAPAGPLPLTLYFLDPNTFQLYDIPDTTVCVGTTMFYEVDPLVYNPQSQYTWTLNNMNNWPGTNDGVEAYTGIIFNGVQTAKLSVVETNFGCTGPGSDTVTINVLGPPAVSVTGPPQICVGDTIQFSVPLENQTYYSWSAPNGTILDTANNIMTVTYDTSGTHPITIHAVGLCGTADGGKNIAVKAYPVVTPCCDTLVCRHDTVSLSTNSGAYTYVWSSMADTLATTRTITVTPDSTTIYVIASKVSGTAGCTTRDSVTVSVRQPVLNQVSDSICPKQPLLLDPGIPGASYMWNTGATTQTITVNDSGTYILAFKLDTAICHVFNTYSVSVYFKQAAGIDTSKLCPGGMVTLDGGKSGTTYYWNTNATTQSISVDSAGNYNVTVLGLNGSCVETRLFPVKGEDCLLHYPNVFTPNGDGFNDRWFDKDSTFFSNFDVKIYDRWGLLMFESNDCNFQWDGKNKQGNPVSDGVYYYIVAAAVGTTHQELHGTVTVLANKK